MRRVVVLLPFLLGMGCGGSADPTAPVTSEQAQGSCKIICDHELACGSTSTECLKRCSDNVTGWTRRDAMEDQAACTAALDCAQSDVVCLAEIEPLAIHRDWETACRAQLPTCVTRGELEELCTVDYDATNVGLGLLRFAAPVVITELIACTDGIDCSARFTCVNATLDKYNITLFN
jgi:hypothetical protein